LCESKELSSKNNIAYKRLKDLKCAGLLHGRAIWEPACDVRKANWLDAESFDGQFEVSSFQSETGPDFAEVRLADAIELTSGVGVGMFGQDVFEVNREKFLAGSKMLYCPRGRSCWRREVIFFPAEPASFPVVLAVFLAVAARPKAATRTVFADVPCIYIIWWALTKSPPVNNALWLRLGHFVRNPSRQCRALDMGKWSGGCVEPKHTQVKRVAKKFRVQV
jgi:hypothetical protein